LFGLGVSEYAAFLKRSFAARDAFEQTDALLQFVVRVNID
jgi:hypothetical protein